MGMSMGRFRWGVDAALVYLTRPDAASSGTSPTEAVVSQDARDCGGCLRTGAWRVDRQPLSVLDEAGKCFTLAIGVSEMAEGHGVMNNTKWEELRSAMHGIESAPRYRCMTTAGHYSDADAEWFYHLRAGGYDDTCAVPTIQSAF
jgi:hypothetical protein